MISILAEAQQLVNWSKYAPFGNRGLGSIGSLTNFTGISSDIDMFMKYQNKLTLSIAQIETSQNIENIDVIVAVDRIDVLLVEPNDLAIYRGVPMDIVVQVNQAAIHKVADTAEEVNHICRKEQMKQKSFRLLSRSNQKRCIRL